MSDVFQQHGAFSWCELMTTDAAAAEAFYSKVFGWILEDAPIAGMNYKTIKVGDRQLGGLMPIPPSAASMPPAWGLYVTVDDVDASIKLVEELGGNVLMPPMDIPNVGRFAMVQDPQGATFSIITYSRTNSSPE
jgi:predicted enzyme related to lactoylglutathione lyase